MLWYVIYDYHVRCVSNRQQALHFNIDKTNGIDSTLSLNGRRIVPLDPMPLEITTWQVPANLTTDAQDRLLASPPADAIPLSIAFEHTILRTEEGAERMIQFDITSLLLVDDKRESMKLNGQGQKLVQIQLQMNKDTREVSIRDLQVVEREHRAQPFTLKCGRLAMAKTQFDPSDWDAYGEIGSWSRLFSRTFSFLDLQQNPLLLPIALILGLVGIMVRRWLQRGERDIRFADDDEANVALLDIDFEDLPPAYANIPTFKIEEYD